MFHYLIDIEQVHILTLEKKKYLFWACLFKYSHDMEFTISEHYKHCKSMQTGHCLRRLAKFQTLVLLWTFSLVLVFIIHKHHHKTNSM